MYRARRFTAQGVVALATLLGSLTHAPAFAASTTAYIAGGTGVVRDDGTSLISQQGITLFDEGAALCSISTGVGIGGGCVDFGPYDSIQVNDAVRGTAVAFQVCLDNNGDGICTSPDRSPACPDQIFFSHGINVPGGFDNALGPLPTGFLPGCPGGPVRGYVVFICNGLHVDGGAHTHPAVTGSITGTTGGTGISGGASRGDFCGGSIEVQSPKVYFVAP